jgi:hypothetical protein
MPDFNLNIWNMNAEAQLGAEYRRIAAHDPAAKNRGSTLHSFVSGDSTTFGSRFLRKMSFAIANTICCELPAILAANDCVDAVRVMIGKVLASIPVALSAECIVEIEQALLGQCEQIAASCAASDGEKQAARNIEVRSTYLHPVHFFLFPFCSSPLFHSRLTSFLLILTPLRADVCEQYRIHLGHPRDQRIHFTLAVHHHWPSADSAIFADRGNTRNLQL